MYAFSGWTSSQTINVQSMANQKAADDLWYSSWRGMCHAKIKYSK